MFDSATVTSKGQVTLPLKVRKFLDVQAGDSVIFEFSGDYVTLRKVPRIENFFDTLPPLERPYGEQLQEIIASEACVG